MKEIDPGHLYLLDVLDPQPDGQDGPRGNLLQFVKRVGEGYPYNGDVPNEGTNCQEVLRCLISRVEYLNRQYPCLENAAILANLHSALALFELRAARRHGRELHVVKTVALLSNGCPKCGHHGCGCA